MDGCLTDLGAGKAEKVELVVMGLEKLLGVLIDLGEQRLLRVLIEVRGIEAAGGVIPAVSPRRQPALLGFVQMQGSRSDEPLTS